MKKTFSRSWATRLLPVAGIAGLCLQTLTASAAQSDWAHLNPDGKLAYKTLPAGDRIMDFSTAGYLGGGVKLPTVPVKKTVAPSGNDDSAAIQSAIDEVSKMELADGFRGAVLLEPGIFNCSQPLTIKASGVVLRGSGSGANGTTIKMTGAPHLCFAIGGGGEAKPVGKPVAITDAYVPSGTFSVHVSSAEGFRPGDSVLINRPATPTWVKFMGMDTLVRSGKAEHWVSGEIQSQFLRPSHANRRGTSPHRFPAAARHHQ